MNEYREISNPMYFKKFGRYQVFFTVIVTFMGIPYFWENANYSAYAQVASPYCVDPANISNPCSTDCKQIQYSQTEIIDNFITQFNFICGKKWIANNLGWLQLFGTISGALCGHYFSKRFGRPLTIGVSCCLSIFFDLLLVLFNRMDMYLLNRFAQAFTGNGIYINGQIIFTEIIPKEYFNVFIFIKFFSIVISEFFTSCVWAIGRHWIWLISGRIFLTSIVFVLSLFIHETPRWYFVRNNTDEAVASAEKILRFNKESTLEVRAHVEKVWRYSRTRPASKDTFISVFHHKLLRETYLTYIFMKITLVFAKFICLKNIHADLKVQTLLLLDLVSGSLMFVGLIVWFCMTKFIEGRKIFIIGFLVGSYTFIMSLLAPGVYVAWSLSLIGYLVTHILLYENILFLLEFIPGSVRNSAVVMNIVIFVAGYQFAEVVQRFFGTDWFPIFISAVFFFISYVVSFGIVEGRNMPFREFVSETEINLRRLVLNQYR